MPAEHNQPTPEELMEIQLWEYIDGLLAGPERTAVEQLIAGQAEWRNKYGELLALHQNLNLEELDQPSMRFTRNVMEEISRHHIAPATSRYINKNVIRGLALFFITIILGFLAYGFGQIDWSAAGDSGSTLGIDLNKVDYSRLFDNNFVNGFLMLNVIMGLLLLDRYLSNRREELRIKN